MFTDRPLELFVDPNVKPVAISKAAVIPIHLKAAVKANLDREKVNINSFVEWLLRMISKKRRI